MRNRLPADFEIKVMKMIDRQRGGFSSGDCQVHFVAAARRLEKLGYANKTARWWLTDKGDEFFASAGNASPLRRNKNG